MAQTFGSLAAAERRNRVPGRPSAARLRLEPAIARSADMILASSAEELADLASLGVRRARVRVAGNRKVDNEDSRDKRHRQGSNNFLAQ